MHTTSAWWLLSMAEYFRRINLPVYRLFELSGISFQSLMHPNTRYPQDGVTKLWEFAEQYSGNKDIGFYAGRNLSIAGIPVLGQSLISATSMQDGFERFFRYQRILGESANIRQIEREQSIELRFNFVGDTQPICKHTYDMAIAGAVSMARVLAGQAWVPKQVRLRRTKPRDTSDFEGYFGCVVAFESSENCIQIRKTDFIQQFEGGPAFDMGLSQMLSDKSDKPVTALLAMFLKQQCQDTVLDKTTAAKALNMSSRSLQRRLEVEGSTFRDVLAQARKDKALGYLAEHNLSLTAIAFLCGFSDVTAFNRAFKRWFGQSPGDYRKTHICQ